MKNDNYYCSIEQSEEPAHIAPAGHSACELSKHVLPKVHPHQPGVRLCEIMSE